MTDMIGELSGTVSIGQLAKVTGVSTRTIRYYEELGILPAPVRSPGGTRKYPQEYRRYIETALSLKELGFPLEQIKPLARLALGKALTPTQRDRAAQLVAERLDVLGRQVSILLSLRDSVQGSGATSPEGIPPRPRAEADPMRLLELTHLSQ
jgi:MerR family mercuric resistance operon transcriptional regulator